MSEIKPGDVVYLKSGSPAMTVDRIIKDRGNAVCVWFVDVENKEAIYSHEALTKDNPNPKTVRTRALAL